MDRREFLTSMLAVSSLGLAACADGRSHQGGGRPNSRAQGEQPDGATRRGAASGGSAGGATTTAPAPDRPKLGPRQLAGQRVIFSYAGLSVPKSLLDQVESGQAGGVIFFKQNIESDAQIKAAIAQLRTAQQHSPVPHPLLLMTDQEGGLVRRLPGPPAWSEKQIGASSNPTGEASQAGRRAGNNLAGVGMNLNLAPVLDVYYKPGNFIDQYGRSYSDKASVVSECGQAMISAQQRVKVAATGKHFPGLGSAATNQNTDEEPVTLTVSASELRSKDEVPYDAAIKAGLDLVMCSWAVYPSLDAKHPAGLSETIVQGELRQRHKFGGVTITDAIEAGALESWGSYGQRAVTAAGVGMDLVLCSAQSVSEGLDALDALESALTGDKLDPGRFNRAVDRITHLRSKLA
ncbi:MAG TPA: glycoside hydrolase family 3 N-terminal domain-containing protein [Acidimicrobiales bacterium]|nr:glycoside hydrolase family 3 N-terminal domain-containing protein [Acidimicrobiales bacterium]